MHELSIAQAIVETACQAVEPGQRILSVRLRVGQLSGIVEESLRFCFDVATAGTALAGCRLDIENVPILLFCVPCQREFQPAHSYRLVCPSCQQPSSDLRAGRELLIESLEVDDESPDP